MYGYSSANFEGQLKAMRDKEKKKPRKKTEAELFYKRKSTKKCNFWRSDNVNSFEKCIMYFENYSIDLGHCTKFDIGSKVLF